MQTDAKAAAGKPQPHETYDPLLKEQALKILMDYSASTKRKWRLICKEILQLASTKATVSAPLLNRQDLESWAGQRSILGDDKFRHVLEFLTHPATLARPEFAHAAGLTDPFYKVLRVGRALAEFYSDFDNSAWLGKPELHTPKLTREEIERRANTLAGIYVGELKGRNVCLSLERISGEPFFIAHYLLSPIKFGGSGDWNLDRQSGYVTVGHSIIAHLKGVLVNHTRGLRILPPREDGPPPELVVVSDDIIHKALEIVMWDSLESVRKTLPYISPFEYHVKLRRSDESQLRDLIAYFRWRIPA